MNARIDTLLVEADSLTKLKRAASKLEEQPGYQNDLDKLKLQFEKIWRYSTGTSAQHSSESENATEIKDGASGVGEVQLKIGCNRMHLR